MQHTGDVGQERKAFGAEADGERRRSLVGIYVQRPLGERRDDRDEPGCKRVEDRLGTARQRVADEAELGDVEGRSPISSPASPTARGPIAAQSCALTASSVSRTTPIAASQVIRRPR